MVRKTKSIGRWSNNYTFRYLKICIYMKNIIQATAGFAGGSTTGPGKCYYFSLSIKRSFFHMSPISNYLVLLLLRSLQRINTGEELIFLVFGHGFSKSFLLFPVITPSVTKTPQATTKCVYLMKKSFVVTL